MEKEKGKISRLKTDVPLDILDKAITDLKKYNHDLIINDPTLSQMLENLIKCCENAAAQKEDLLKVEEQGLDYLEIEDKDYEEFNKLLESGVEEEEVEEE